MADDLVSLLEHVDIMQLNCLNESAQHTFADIAKHKKLNTSQNFLLSDADEQLLLNIPACICALATRVAYSIVLVSPIPPKRVKLLVNRPSIGFEDVEDAEEPEVAQILDLSEDDVKNGKPIALRYVRFQNANSLHIFVVSNQGGTDETRIDAVDVLGIPVETTKDLAGLRQEEHNH
ncbi:DUF1000-domain-containing protein [Mycena sanguinolenta]|uniref:DUF1000-domain-containing protein n=1 Tax=Mycena sanguinolenta TaxID=230812 RepID=A0A8H6YJK6_9AGAR|nr:DUF1000-domain-containing protein [Mycena sanguinolenta]